MPQGRHATPPQEPRHRAVVHEAHGRLAVGLVWVVLTVGVELLLGCWVLDHSWERILSDYDLRRGGLLPVGLAALALSPFIAAGLRRVPSQ